MFLRVVRRESIGGCTLEVVIIIGRAREAEVRPWTKFGGSACGRFWGDEAAFRLVRRDRLNVGSWIVGELLGSSSSSQSSSTSSSSIEANVRHWTRLGESVCGRFWRRANRTVRR